MGNRMEIQGLVDEATVSGPRARQQLTRLTYHPPLDDTQVQSQAARMLIPAPLHPGCVNVGLHFRICPMAILTAPLSEGGPFITTLGRYS